MPPLFKQCRTEGSNDAAGGRLFSSSHLRSKSLSIQLTFSITVAWLAGTLLGCAPVAAPPGKPWNPPAPLSSSRAIGYVDQLCKIGSRTTGTPGMIKQQELLDTHFTKLGATVSWQAFDYRNPKTGATVEVKNMIVQWQPQLTRRILVASHYDTRPFPDRDGKNKLGLFVGANDGGSSTALLMELGHALKGMKLTVGVDFIFFDAEELVYDGRIGEYFVGSTRFAQEYVSDPPNYRYEAGVLTDMIGDKDLNVGWDEASYQLAPQLAIEVWGIAKELKLSEFRSTIMHNIQDDHLALNNIAGIPTIDIIDFDFPRTASTTNSYWHTMADTPDKCSGDSITKVAAVVLEWIKRRATK